MTTSQRAFPSPADLLAPTRSFRELDRPTLTAVVAAAETYHLAAGETLFRAGDPCANIVYILYAGRMRQRRLSGEDIEVELGDLLGMANYLDRAPYHSTVEAISDCVLLGIAAETMEQLERGHPTLLNCLNRIMAHKLWARSTARDINSGALAQPVRSVMTAPISACAPDMRLREALTIMRERHIGSLVVTTKDHKLLGLLTQASLSEAVLLHDAHPDDPIMPTACQVPYTVGPETPLWQAQEIQQRQRAKYVVVVDEDIPIGVVSQTDILRTLIASPATLTPHIAQAESLPELAALKVRLAEESAHIRETNRLARVAVRFLSETHLALQRRVIDLTLQGMRRKGDGEPPLPFAILIMGSGGRKEMLLHPDQDNGIIIADAPEADQPAVQSWFERFAQRLNENLAYVGYPLCPGDIMARSPQYRHTLTQWQQQISLMLDRPTEQAARWSNIFFDFTTLYGDDTLTTALWRHVLATIQAHPRLLMRMAADDARGRPALGFFNQLIPTTRDATGAHIDLKRNGLRLIADATRIFALRAGVSAQNTADRLAALVRAGTLPEVFSASVGEAYDILLDLLLAHQIDQARAGIPFDTLLDLKTLPEQSRATLRLGMRIVKRFQDRLQETYGITYVD